MFNTRNGDSDYWHQPWNPDFIFIAESAAKWCTNHGILTVGLDYLTIDPPSQPTFPAHLELLGKGTLIIENLRLRDVAPGTYELLETRQPGRGRWRLVPRHAANPGLTAMRFLTAEFLSAWGMTCLRKLGLPALDARFVAECLVQTSLWGIDSHGIERLPHYLGRLEAGSLNPQPAMRFEKSGPCTGLLDGNHGLGLVVCQRATHEAIAMAREYGLGFIGVRESSHCGAIGLFGG